LIRLLPTAATATVASPPLSSRPVTWLISREERSSIGLAPTPRASVQSMVEEGSAT
jgi:hypothetical protein